MSSESGVDDEDSATKDTPESNDRATELERLRAENASLKEQLTAAPTETTLKPSRGYRRRWLSITSAVFAVFFVVMAVTTMWTYNTLLDSASYVETVAPLADDADIQEAVTFRVTEVVAEAADFESLATELLPEDASILAMPIASGAESLISGAVGEVVASDQFSQVWEDAHLVAHENVVFVLTGESTEVIQTEDGRVVLQLGPLAEEVLDLLGEQLGTDIFEQVPAEELDAELILVESEALADVQGAVQFFDTVAPFTPILALLLLAGTVFFAEDRRLGVRRMGLAIAIPMFLAILAYGWARDQYLAGLPSDVHNPDAVAAVFDILTRFLLQELRAVLIAGVLLVVGAWAVGPSRPATKVRGWWDALLGRAGAAGADREVGPVPAWVSSNERSLIIAIGLIAGLALVVWTKPTGLVVVGLFVLAGVLVGLVRIVGEVGRRSERASAESLDRPDGPTPGDESADVPAEDSEQPGEGEDQESARDNAPESAAPINS